MRTATLLFRLWLFSFKLWHSRCKPRRTRLSRILLLTSYFFGKTLIRSNGGEGYFRSQPRRRWDRKHACGLG
jgi:hypothetical protein